MICDAFSAFLEWAIAFIQEVIDAVFGPIVDVLDDLAWRGFLNIY